MLGSKIASMLVRQAPCHILFPPHPALKRRVVGVARTSVSSSVSSSRLFTTSPMLTRPMRRPFRQVEVRKLGPGRGHNKMRGLQS